jgi:hypothetical protein
LATRVWDCFVTPNVPRNNIAAVNQLATALQAGISPDAFRAAEAAITKRYALLVRVVTRW